VRLVEVDGLTAVARLSRRSEAGLDWELALMSRLRDAGIVTPHVVPTRDGRHRVGALVVVTRVAGEPPSTAQDWADVAAAAGKVHRATVDWPQRPGRCSVLDLRELDGDDEIDLTDVPADVQNVCRTAWSRLTGSSTSVVVGDVSAGNVRMTEAGPVFLDWAMAHVDVVDLEVVSLPEDATSLPGRRRWQAGQGASAVAAVASWNEDPVAARGRLDEIEPP
jgi:Ser/Thr protein kinase RdoA (MazF antagonist)